MKTRYIAAASALLLVIGGAAQAQQMELKIGHTLNPSSHYHKAAEKFKEVVEARTNGDITVSLFPQSQLGGEVKMLQSARLGAVDLVVTSSAPLENTVPEMAILSLPYLFDNLDEADKVLQGDAGRHFLDYMEPRGLVGLTFLSAIERSVYTSKKPIKTVADIGNLKLRVMQSPSYVAAYEAFGAQPTPMAYSEVYLALQNGVVDGAENSPDTFVMDRMTEVTKYLNMTKAHYMPSLMVMSKVRFDALSDEQKAIVADAAKEAAQASISTFRSTYTESLDKVKEANVEIVETDRAEFAKAAQAVWPSIVANTPDGEKNLKVIEDAKAK
ncbi:TRAP transporter substrate-binding protein [Mesorhizobium sp. ZMM04-4]